MAGFVSGGGGTLGDSIETAEITDGSVTLVKLANLAQDRVIGRISTGSGVPEALTGSNVRSIAGLATTDAPTFAGLTLTGQAVVANGSKAAPSVVFAGATDTGFYRQNNAAGFCVKVGGTVVWCARSDVFRLSATAALSWSSGDAEDLGSDLLFYRDAANTLAQRNGTNAQAFRLYETFTDSSNYSRLSINFNAAASNVAIRSEASGTGSARNIAIASNRDVIVGSASGRAIFFYNNYNPSAGTGTQLWSMSSSGHLLAGSDNTYDIGASGATRPRTGYFGTSLITPLISITADAGLTLSNQTNYAGANSVGINNAPVSGAPTFWCPIDIGGTVYAFPCWATA